ncbi:MAG: TRAP transporter small permease subunit [Alphaproteobacteria bacterium]|nr:TRAP transporter small permease subunit [Alphaproteobacteria bacterium]TAD88412.1 MAG: TRAP transporter small permease subunit [Alphaproteobacteria bacterium]
MSVMEGFIRVVDTINDLVGKATAWLTIGTVLVCFAVVVFRYVFSLGFIWLQELYVWQHAVVFMMGAGYTLMKGGHVRVDIWFGGLGPRGRAWVEIFGTLVFLLPWMIVLAYTSIPFISQSWWLREVSPQANGLPGYFLLKSVIWAFCLLVSLQALASMARAILVLKGRTDMHPAWGGSH